MNKRLISIEASPWLNSDGTIQTDVFIGDEHVFSENNTINDLIDQELEAFISPLTNKISEHHKEDVEMILKTLKKAYKHAKQKIKELS